MPEPAPKEESADRALVREVVADVAEEWRGMSGGEKAGAVVGTIDDGVATLWNVGVTLAVILAAGFWLFTSCSGTAHLSASTTCDQFLKMDTDTRDSEAQESEFTHFVAPRRGGWPAPRSES